MDHHERDARTISASKIKWRDKKHRLLDGREWNEMPVVKPCVAN